jgi:hypothetical protein
MLSQIVFLRESGRSTPGIPGNKKPNENSWALGKWWKRGKSITSTIQRFPSDFTELLNPISLGFGVHLEFQVGGSIR